MLSRTRFRPQFCGIEIDDLVAIPSDEPCLFIVGIEQKQDPICKKLRTQYPRSSLLPLVMKSITTTYGARWTMVQTPRCSVRPPRMLSSARFTP
jgi:hypothetical protein